MIDKVQENLREVPLDAEFAVYWRHGKDIYGIAGDRLDALVYSVQMTKTKVEAE